MRRVHTLLILLPALLSAQAARGHALDVQCGVVPPDRVVVEAIWGEDEPVAQGAVTVLDANGDTLLRGTTDVAGRFECSIEFPQALIVEVVFAGHRGECEVSAAEFEEQVGAVTPSAAAPHEPAAHEHEHEHEHADANHTHAADADHHDHNHADEHRHDRGDSAEHDHAHHDAGHHAAAASDGSDRHEHAADNDHRAELAAGIALILSVASFLMVLSLRREVKSLAARSHNDRS